MRTSAGSAIFGEGKPEGNFSIPNKMASVNYTFVSSSDISDDYICPMTGKIMLEPCQTECCGNHLSSSVVKRLAEEEKKPCPLCSAPNPAANSSSSGGSGGRRRRTFVARLDLFFQRQIHKVQVRCFHYERGCEWVGALKEVHSHSSSCDMQPWKCQHCGFESTHLAGTTEHAQKCPKRPVECSNNCGETAIPYGELDEHLRACPAQPVPCEFKYAGCMEMVARCDMSQHMCDSISSHQLLVAQQTLSVVTGLGVSFERERSDVASLKEKLAAARDKSERAQKMLRIKEQEIKSAEGKVRKLEEKLKEVAEEKQALSSSIDFVVGQHQDLVERKDVEIQNLRMRDNEASLVIVERLKSQLEEKEDDDSFLQQQQQMQRDRVNSVTSASMELLQAIAADLKCKKSLNSSDLSTLVSQLEEVIAHSWETTSLSSNDGNFDGSNFCRGVSSRVVIGGLKKPWGVAAWNGKIYVVDNGGSFGLHVVAMHGLEASLPSAASATSMGCVATSTTAATAATTTTTMLPVETMIASASISEITVPPGKCWYPRSVAIDSDSNIILADTGTHRVLKFSPRGKLLASAGSESASGSSPGLFNSPLGIGVSPTRGTIFVCDRCNHRVQVLRSDLRFLDEFGTQGAGDNQFSHPWDVAFDAQGNAYVADCGNRCVKVFTSELKPLRVIGRTEGRKYKPGDLRAPSSLCVDAVNGFLYVADMGYRRVLVYDIAGNFKCTFGHFVDPRGVAVDDEGRVFVSDRGGGSLLFPLQASGRVQMFS